MHIAKLNSPPITGSLQKKGYATVFLVAWVQFSSTINPECNKIFHFRKNNFEKPFLSNNFYHGGTTRLFTNTFLRLAKQTMRKQRDRSGLIQGLTYINKTCKRRNLSDLVDQVHSTLRFWKTICAYGYLSEQIESTHDCPYASKKDNFDFSILSKAKVCSVLTNDLKCGQSSITLKKIIRRCMWSMCTI